jgi:hypothetical protein
MSPQKDWFVSANVDARRPRPDLSDLRGDLDCLLDVAGLFSALDITVVDSIGGR